MSTGSHDGPMPVAFIDIEASGLDPNSWPVEVGWVFNRSGDGDQDNNSDGAAYLVAPADEWPMSAWSDVAEGLHGLDIETLRSKGRSVRAVCDAIEDALCGMTVYSDAPDWDGFWLMRLFSAAGRKVPFSLADFNQAIREPLLLNPGLIETAERIAPRNHRAADDARHLAALFRLATNAV
ncbi:MAG: hypothetical protein AAFR21_01500 [Pseudomonadota bacterium]